MRTFRQLHEGPSPEPSRLEQRFGRTSPLVLLLVFSFLVCGCEAPNAMRSGNGHRHGQHEPTHRTATGQRWNGARIASGTELESVSCPTASFCMAVGRGPRLQTRGFVYIYKRGTWTRGLRLDLHTYADSVSCASASFCVVVDSLPDSAPQGYQGGYAFIYRNGSWSKGTKIDLSGELGSVACPAINYCLAANESGAVFAYDHRTWTSIYVRSGKTASSIVSCSRKAVCVAVGEPGSQLAPSLTRSWSASYMGGSWSNGPMVHFNSTGFLSSLSCVGRIWCMAIEAASDPYSYVLKDGRWSSGSRIPKPAGIPAVSCATSNWCVAVDDSWAVIDAHSEWGKPLRLGSATLNDVSCASRNFCMAVGWAYAPKAPNVFVYSSSTNG